MRQLKDLLDELDILIELRGQLEDDIELETDVLTITKLIYD